VRLKSDAGFASPPHALTESVFRHLPAGYLTLLSLYANPATRHCKEAIMRLKIHLLLVLVAILAILAGCAMPLKTNAVVKFYTPSKISVVKPGSWVMVTSFKNHGFTHSRSFLYNISREINKTGYFHTFVSDTPRLDRKATHIMNIDNFMAFRQDNAEDTKYNTKFIIKQRVKNNRKGEKIGSYEYIAEERGRSSTATLITTVTIYEIESLEPLIYFNIVSTDCSWKRLSKSPKGPARFEKTLTKQIISKLKDMITWDKKEVGVIIPDGCDATAKSLLLQSKYRQTRKRLRPLLPPTNILTLPQSKVLKKYAEWQKTAEEARKAGNKSAAPRNMEKDLKHYYLYLMAQEGLNLSVANLRNVHDGYTAILGLTEDSSLSDACAHSLGRVEVKARRIYPGLSLVEGPPEGPDGPEPPEPEPTSEKDKKGFRHIGTLSPKTPTIGHILYNHFRSWKKVNHVLKTNRAKYPDDFYKRLPIGAKVFINEEDVLEIDRGR